MTDTTETRTRTFLLTTGIALGVVGVTTALVRRVQRTIQQRGYSPWEECRCEFKNRETFFQVWHSRHERQGETILSHEWGIYLVQPPAWQRRFLHQSAQILAALNPLGRSVEHIELLPQEAHQYAAMLHASSKTEEMGEQTTTETESETPYIAWRSEVLRFPQHLFDACTHRLYPAHLSRERLQQAQPLPAIWDAHSNLPLPLEGPLQHTPKGTRIDCIGWSPTQISYCTARVKPRLLP